MSTSHLAINIGSSANAIGFVFVLVPKEDVGFAVGVADNQAGAVVLARRNLAAQGRLLGAKVLPREEIIEEMERDCRLKPLKLSTILTKWSEIVAAKSFK